MAQFGRTLTRTPSDPPRTMPEPAEPSVHRRLAAACFNEAWDHLDRTERTP